MIFKNLQKRRVWILVNYYTFFIAFLFSVFTTNIFNFLFKYIFLLLIILSINLIFWYKKYWKIVLYLILWIVLWYWVSINAQNKILGNYNVLYKESGGFENKITIKWEIIDNYKQTDISNSSILRLDYINSKKIKNTLNILVNTSTKISLNKWDLIEYSWKITKISNFNDFEYDKFLLLKDIYWQSNIYQFVKRWNNLHGIWKFIYNFRMKILTIINKLYPWNSAKLLSWIFIWERWNYDDSLKNWFNNSWLAHIIAVSWYNITILIIFFGIILRNFPIYLKNVLIISAIIFFLLMIGNNLPAIRAWIMWIIWYLAMQYWRKINIYSILIIIAFIFVLLNPLIINYDISFYLTFLALVWLLSIQKDLSGYFKFLPERFWIKESVTTTLSVLIFTIPIMLSSFEKISIISPISNLLVLPMIPFAMLFWWISIIIYFIFKNIGIYIWYVAYLILKYILTVSDILWNWQYSTINYDLWEYKNIFVIFYYIVLIFFILYYRKDENI